MPLCPTGESDCRMNRGLCQVPNCSNRRILGQRECNDCFIIGVEVQEDNSNRYYWDKRDLGLIGDSTDYSVLTAQQWREILRREIPTDPSAIRAMLDSGGYAPVAMGSGESGSYQRSVRSRLHWADLEDLDAE